MRKQLDEMKSRRDEQKQPKDGEQKKPLGPRDPEQRTSTRPEDEEASGSKRPDNAPAWAAFLPPQIRDSFVRGDFDKIPPRYVNLIRRYLIRLNRAASEEGPASGGR